MKKRFGVRVLALLISALMVMAAFSGCGKSSDNGGTSSAGKEKITVLLPQNEMDTVGFMKKQTQNFEDSTGIQVELINESWDNVQDKVTAEMTSGGSSYDVIEFDNSWVSKFTANKWIIPIDSYMTQDMKTGIIPGLLKIFSANGSVYGIPWNNDTRFFMYNKTKLDAAGIKAPPTTWDELITDSKILQSKGLVKYGFIDAYKQGQEIMNAMTEVVYTEGGDFLKNGNGAPTVTSDPAVKSAFELINKAMNVDKVIDPASLTSDQQNACDVFTQGNTAFFPQAWAGVYQLANDPKSSKIVGQIAVAPYALGVTGKSQVVLSLPEAMSIPTTSKHKDAAWKYIEYMSSKTFDKDKALTIGALPIYNSTFSDAAVLKKYPFWVNFGKQSAFARGLNPILWYDQFSSTVEAESQKILLKQDTVDAGLQSMQDQLTRIAQ